ncbi:MAG: hypothetical protein CMF46_02065 [Legionellales bacterium]|nr:hypothetical protein [Legionellales bacterium]|tara:strand:+ start:119 stop:424 length:306 start_codon:yes stop_codon:yes gene_type:complete
MNDSSNIRIKRLTKRYDQALRKMLATGDLGAELKFITIKRLSLSKDIGHLKIFYANSRLQASEGIDYQQRLDEKIFLIQKVLAKQNLRKIPKIRFIHDPED